MYSAITQPNIYSAGYSAVPLRITSDESTTLQNFQYVTNLTWDKVSVTAMSSYALDNLVYSNCISSTEHNFSIGDVIMLNDEDNGNEFTNYWIIRKITSTTSFVIDLPFEYSPTNPFSVSRVIKYLMPADLDGEAKLDLSNTLKNFVTQNLLDSDDIYLAPDSLFEYDITCGSEYTYVFPFTGLGQVNPGGTTIYLTLINSGMTATTDQEFQIGDIINIQQDLFEWPYTDNYFSSGSLGFTGTTANPFPSVPNGTNLLVTGQITQPYYNGPTSLTSISIDDSAIVTDKFFSTSTPVEGGIIYLTPQPDFNTTATITDIQYSAGTGVIITTNVVQSGILTSLAGTASPVASELTLNPNQFSITGNTVYNARLETLDYDIDGFDKYVCQFRSASANNISTILGNTDRYRVEPSTKSWLLAHDGSDISYLSPRFYFYDSNDSIISTMIYNYPYAYGPSVPINSYTDNSGDLQINLNSAHNMLVGESLEVFGAYAPYNGVWEIIEINSSTSLTVDTSYAGNLLVGGEYVQKVTITTPDDFYFPIGLNQLTGNTQSSLQTGSDLSTIISDVSYYKVELSRLGSAASNVIWFDVNDDCSSYDVLHLMWKDRLGSWLSMPFKYKSRNNVEVERKNYYKSTGKWDDDTFGYDSFGRGDKTFYSRSRDSKVVNSGWLEDFENVLIKDLFKSANVQVQLPDGTLVACQINDTAIELIKSDNLEMISYQFSINYSRNDYRF